MDFNKLTIKSQEAVAAAQDLARRRGNPELTRRRLHPTAEEHARWANHVRYMIPLERLLGYLRAAGFGAVDVYYKRLEWVVYGGHRPA